MIMLRPATREDIPALQSISPNEAGYFERCFDESRLIVIAAQDGIDCGYGQLNYTPRYNLYKKLSYPEIQDVNVCADHRRRGIATQIIQRLEAAAQERYQGVGISVGVTKDFGAAQRLYIKLGYVPDGFGATCDREPVNADLSYPVNEVCLMLVKEF